MKPYKKIVSGSIVAFFIGTSCCWMSSLAIWVGGITFTGIVVKTIGDVPMLLIGLGILLVLTSIYLYSKMKVNSKN